MKFLTFYYLKKKTIWLSPKTKHLSRLFLFQSRLPFFLIRSSFFWFLKFSPTSIELKLSELQCRRQFSLERCRSAIAKPILLPHSNTKNPTWKSLKFEQPKKIDASSTTSSSSSSLALLSFLSPYIS